MYHGSSVSYRREARQSYLRTIMVVHEDAGHTQDAKQELMNNVDFEQSTTY